MKTAKQATLEWVQDLPEDASMRAILDRIEYLSRIEEGLGEADRGDIVPNKQVMEELRAWRPSSGR